MSLYSSPGFNIMPLTSLLCTSRTRSVRPFGRGNPQTAVTPASSSLASMGPRPFGRGNRQQRNQFPKQRLASMGPRPFGRGNEGRTMEVSKYWKNRGKTLGDRRPGKTYAGSTPWDLGCDECCSGLILQDDCDHRFLRESCPYCLGTGKLVVIVCAASDMSAEALESGATCELKPAEAIHLKGGGI